MKLNHNLIQGVFMLALAAICFWLPSHLSKEGAAHQKMLVADGIMTDARFQESVIVILRHNGFGAFGFVINKQDGEGRAAGGPVEAGEVFTLHSPDVVAEDSQVFEPMHLAYTKGEAFARSFGTEGRGTPGSYIVFRGYSGWGIEQLAREMKKGRWKVIDYDPALVFETPPDEIYAVAAERAGIR